MGKKGWVRGISSKGLEASSDIEMGESLREHACYEDYLDTHLVDEDLYYLKVRFKAVCQSNALHNMIIFIVTK